MFVDIRFRRSGRAKGFSGVAFEHLVGRTRYRWMRGLGNRSIGTRERRIHILNPTAVKDLLDLVIQCKGENRRVLFFCACQYPRWCHRRTVSGLILNAAVKAGRHIQIVEWPGGKPLRITMDVRRGTLEAVLRGRKSVPLGNRRELGRKVCLPWGSVVNLRAGGEIVPIVTGPARYRNGWCLPVLLCTPRPTHLAQARGCSERLRKEHDLEPRRV